MGKTKTVQELWKEALQYAEKTVETQNEVIAAQKEQIRHFTEQISVRQQNVLDEYGELFEELFPDMDRGRSDENQL